MFRKMQEEDPDGMKWPFADPDNKYGVKHNKWLHLWLSHMQTDLADYDDAHMRAIEWQTVKTIIMKAMVNNDLDMPMVDALDRKCKTLASSSRRPKPTSTTRGSLTLTTVRSREIVPNDRSSVPYKSGRRK